jgi:hypothetical protein
MGMESDLIHAYQSSPKDRLRSFPPNQEERTKLIENETEQIKKETGQL